MRDTGTIILADARLRVRVRMGLVLSGFLSVLVLAYLDAYVGRLAALQINAPQLAVVKLRLFLLVTSGLAFFSTLGLASILITVAVRVLSSGQYPPPGMRVIQDTKLQIGQRARMTAIIGMALAVLLLLCGIGVSLLLVHHAYDPRLYRTVPRLQAHVVFGHLPMALPVYQADTRSVSIRYGTPIRSTHNGARASGMQRLMTAETSYTFPLLESVIGLPARRVCLA